MRTPKRIQRKRTRGWTMPAGAVYVGRPTKWGNPFRKTESRIQNPERTDLEKSLEPLLAAMPTSRKLHSRVRKGYRSWHDQAGNFMGGISEEGYQAWKRQKEHDEWARLQMLVTLFTYKTVLWRIHDPAAYEKWIAPLRGKDLVCWCPQGAPCHADVLLRLANEKEQQQKGTK